MNWHQHFADGLGLIGVILVLVAYGLLQINKMSAESLSYSVTNLFGASFILYSLTVDWNLSAAIVEAAWILISLIGIVKWMRGRGL